MDVSNEVLVVLGAILVLIGILLFLHASRSNTGYRPKYTNNWLTRQLEFQIRVFPMLHLLVAAGAFVVLGCILAGAGLGWVDFQ
jgi:hypothetical protein